MNDLERHAVNLLSAVVRADDHPNCWFCRRGTAVGAHHHFGDACGVADVPASANWSSEKAS